MEVLALIGLIVLNGLFAMSEISLTTARRARLTRMASDGHHSAEVALKLGEDPTRILSTTQIGLTSISLMSGIMGEAVFAAPLSAWMQSMGVAPGVASPASTVLVVVGVTYLSIVIGELVPKRLGQLAPEIIACRVARPMRALSSLTHPFVALLTASTHGLLRLMGVNQQAQSGVTEDEVHAMLQESSETGLIEQHQHEMMRNVFRLDDRQLGSLMIPRSDIVFVDLQLPAADNLQRIIESDHTRFPVCDGNQVLGVVHAKQVLSCMLQNQPADYRTCMQPGLYVPDTLTGTELIEQIRTHNQQMVFIVDEYGEISGIVTLHDILEAITGEFAPHNPADAMAVRRADGSWLLDGAISIAELKDRLATTAPEEESGRYYTLGGMMMFLLARVPQTGDCAEWDGWQFEIVDMDGRRIDKVLASQRPASEPA